MQVTNWQEEKDPILREAKWEREMHYEGMARYEASKVRGGKSTDFVDTNTGTNATRKILKELGTDVMAQVVSASEEAIEDKRKEILKPKRVERRKKAGVLCVPAETSALLTVKTMLESTFGVPDPSIGQVYSKACRKLGRSIEEEFNFRSWIASSRHSASEYAKTNGLNKTPVSIAEKLLKEQGVTKRNLRYWRNIFEDFEEYEWDADGKQLAFFVGDILMQAVVDRLPEVFEFHHPRVGKHTAKHLRMTEDWRDKLAGREHKYATSKVVKLPMLTKPKDWQPA